MENSIKTGAVGGLTGNQLKLIAIVAMTLDHFVWTISPGCPGYNYAWWAILAHIIGRVTAPIMWFMVVEGYYHTRSVGTYIKRLLAFALLSHFAYRFCFGHPLLFDGITDQTGIGWPLMWGLIVLAFWKSDKYNQWQKILLLVVALVVTFPSDWSCTPVLAILTMGLNRGNFKKQMIWMECLAAAYAVGYILTTDVTYGFIQACAFLSIPLLAAYNGERGRSKFLGRFMYWYYPCQLIAFGVMKLLIF